MNKRNQYEKKIGNYLLTQKIGSGSFAKVYKGVKENTEEKVAIKMISKDKLGDQTDQIE